MAASSWLLIRGLAAMSEVLNREGGESCTKAKDSRNSDVRPSGSYDCIDAHRITPKCIPVIFPRRLNHKSHSGTLCLLQLLLTQTLRMMKCKGGW